MRERFISVSINEKNSFFSILESEIYLWLYEGERFTIVFYPYLYQGERFAFVPMKERN